MKSELKLKNKTNNLGNDRKKNYTKSNIKKHQKKATKSRSKILMLSTYPPRECGIATYTQDLKKALTNTFQESLDIKICAIETDLDRHSYDYAEVELVLNIDNVESFVSVARDINSDENLDLIMVQHEFGLYKNNLELFHTLLNIIEKPIILAFHTVLPNPNPELEKEVKNLGAIAKTITVMTESSADILIKEYNISPDKIEIISHGTHLVNHQKKDSLKEKYNLTNHKVISTFGFIGPGKSIETTLDALPIIIAEHPDIMFLIVGKTHPTIFSEKGHAYMDFLLQKVEDLNLHDYVKFVNKFVPLPELLDYLLLSDCYIFSSKDPNQAVSGTFSYAVSCGCPIISTPIPHAKEVLKLGNGLLFDFGDSNQLAHSVIKLLNDEHLMEDMRLKNLHNSAANAWENAAISHAHLFSRHTQKPLTYKKPRIMLDHIKRMTTDVGIIQFSKINAPDSASGYTLDDNARALIALVDHYKITLQKSDLVLIRTYIRFILNCQRTNGEFLNYVNEHKEFTKQNNDVNLEDSNGRAIWALGYVFSLLEEGIDINETLLLNIKWAINQFIPHINHYKSPRALGFIIKGLYYYNTKAQDAEVTIFIKNSADKLVRLYEFHSEDNWNWFENYLTYANSVLPESLLFSWKATGDLKYKTIAKTSLDFLLSKIIKDKCLKVISNKNWLLKDFEDSNTNCGGEQPIDVAYTILALKQFDLVFPKAGYNEKMELAFSWFLGNNQLNQIIYNPCTGGCYDGLETHTVNLNQGAESTISYLLARLVFEQ
ncbi:glycosyltransferase (GT4) [Formosa agariphila KMM 3901]|uniref:Glycosyltransferase (GT4) n=1 Tax=Formosa agariphila (strain DSM 15362 / KCTC 12365 / LMG 23005 / KMM 3901 / M-2Alg 35-1) TaxID=1347342 RepID=T2KPE8_FORAG|nr:glycosyltransferase [Formosa agariphila]CDF80321.1 glycosyltransferase (GT4) [Formosa agariphila KMM 3901]